MSKIAYFDCFSGASGDMILGSLIDAGLDFEFLKKSLSGLDFHGYRLSSEKVVRSSITAVKFNVVLDEETEHEHDHHHDNEHGHFHVPHRGLTEILKIIESGHISEKVKNNSNRIFRHLGEIEAGIHGIPVEDVHFHELGAVDTIIDVVGTMIGLEALGIEKIYSSPLAVGSGTVKTAHGILPVPAPATLKILAGSGAPVVNAPPSDTPPGELLTPTGAALICMLASGFKQPVMSVHQVGYGAGNKQFATWPNVVRVWIGEETQNTANPEMVLLETNIDDMNPQNYGYLMERLFTAKAADVWFTPIQMKKNRPAIMVSVLGPAELENELTEIVMRETSTLGVRSRPVNRHTAHREIIEFNSSLGNAHAKLKRFGDSLFISPEYEDCRRIAIEHDLPLQEIYRVLENEARQFLVSHPGKY
jgi:pyridinium-3,5-bisthiocarboxylic acid mononucleotide nickel chelatase